MKITTIGMDLAKQVFQVHGVNAKGSSKAAALQSTGRPTRSR